MCVCVRAAGRPPTHPTLQFDEANAEPANEDGLESANPPAYDFNMRMAAQATTTTAGGSGGSGGGGGGEATPVFTLPREYRHSDAPEALRQRLAEEVGGWVANTRW
jgi:hypothetical protein